MTHNSNQWVEVGRVSGVFGVKGWVKVFSHTRPRDEILAYSPWYLNVGGTWQPVQVLGGYLQGGNIVAGLEGYTDRDQAKGLKDVPIAISPDQLPALEADEFYWRDLVGLEVVNTAGEVLGKVQDMMETGANDVLILNDKCLVPFTSQTVRQVDLEQGRILVDWDIDF